MHCSRQLSQMTLNTCPLFPSQPYSIALQKHAEASPLSLRGYAFRVCALLAGDNREKLLSQPSRMHAFAQHQLNNKNQILSRGPGSNIFRHHQMLYWSND